MADEAALDEPRQLADRRRAGRLAIDNPHLIAILRGQPALDDERDPIDLLSARFDEEHASDALSTPQGIGLALLISAGMWAAIALVVWIAFFR